MPQDLFGDAPAPAPAARAAPRRGPPAQPRHTWFFALRPSPACAVRLDILATGLMAAHGVSGKRTGPERLHVTLEVVGHDVEEDLVDAACRAADALRFAPFEARFETVETFSAPNGPFVLGGDAGLDAVRALRQALAMAMADAGWRPQHAYQPHMTLAYDPRNRVRRTAIEPAAFEATEFALVKSHIGFSRHEVLRTWPLAG